MSKLLLCMCKCDSKQGLVCNGLNVYTNATVQYVSILYYTVDMSIACAYSTSLTFSACHMG
jgi:hypothetical protein